MTRGRRLVRRTALVALASIALVGFSLWLLRDRPRRLVERRLADELGADVRLGRLEFVDPRNFVLHDLRVDLEHAGWSFHVFAERVAIGGGLREINVGRFRSVTAHGGEIRIVRKTTPSIAAPEAATDPVEAAPWSIDRLRIGDARLILAAASGPSELALDADLSEIGRRVRGEIRVHGVDLATFPLLAFAVGPEGVPALQARSALELETTCSSLAVVLRLAGDDSVGIETTGDCPLPIRGRPGQAISLPTVRARAVYPLDDGPVRVEAHLDLADVATVESTFSASPRTGSIDWTSIDAQVADLPTLLQAAGVPIAGADLEGQATIAVRTGADGTRAVSVDVAGHATYGADLLARATFRESASANRASSSWAMNVLLRHEGSGEAARPVEIELDGVLASEAPSSLSVVARARVNAIEGIAIEGKLRSDPEAPAVSDLRIRADRVALGRWLEAAAPYGLRLPPDTTITGVSTLALHAAGPLDALRMSLDIDVEEARVERRGAADGRRVALGDALLHAHLERGGDATVISADLVLRGTLEYPGIPSLPISLAAGAHDANGTISVPAASLSLGEILDVEIADAAIDRTTWKGRARMNVVRADLSRPLAWLDRGRWLSGFDIAAEATADFDVEWDRQARFSADGSVAMGDVHISSADLSRELRGLPTTGRFRVEGVAGVPTSARIDAECDGFELLWQTVYGDWQAIRPRATLHFDRGTASGPPAWSVRANVALDADTAVEATVDGPAEALRFRGGIRARNLAGFYGSHVRGPLGSDQPSLVESWLGGDLTATVAGNRLRDVALHVAGSIDLVDGGFGVPARGIGAQGVGLRLPFDLSTVEQGDAFVGPPLAGELEFDRVDVRGIVFPPLVTAIEARADTLRFGETIALPLYGGLLSIDRLTIHDLLRAAPHVTAGLTLSDLRLADISTALGLPQLAGSLDGGFEQVRVSASELEATGGSRLSVFGGTVELSDIVGRNLFGIYPELSFSAECREIDLYQATEAFEFGSMTGIVQGRIRDFSLFAGVPTRFDALLETTPRTGTKQTITVEAINNLAILGTGGPIGIFDRGIHRLFDRYKYEKFGIRAQLDHDSFLMTGTERRGTKELFLKGSPPLRIDIVNVTPGRPVSFAAMMQRLKSLDLTRAGRSAD